MTSTTSPALHGDFAAGALKLLDGNQAFGLVSEVDDDIFGGDFEDASLQNFVLGRRREVAVVVEQRFIILVIWLGQFFHLTFALTYGHIRRLRGILNQKIAGVSRKDPLLNKRVPRSQ